MWFPFFFEWNEWSNTNNSNVIFARKRVFGSFPLKAYMAVRISKIKFRWVINFSRTVISKIYLYCTYCVRNCRYCTDWFFGFHKRIFHRKMHITSYGPSSYRNPQPMRVAIYVKIGFLRKRWHRRTCHGFLDLCLFRIYI